MQRFFRGLLTTLGFRKEQVGDSAKEAAADPSEPKTLGQVMDELHKLDDRLMDNVRKAGEASRKATEDHLRKQRDDLERMRAISRGECPECKGKGVMADNGLKKTEKCAACDGTGKLRSKSN